MSETPGIQKKDRLLTDGMLDMLAATLRFEDIEGGVTPVPCLDDTGLRILPFALCAQSTGGSMRYKRDGLPDVMVRADEGIVVPVNVPHRLVVTGRKGMVSRWAHLRFSVLYGVDALGFLDVPASFSRSIAQRMGDLCEELASLRNNLSLPALERIARQKSVGLALLAVIARVSPLRESGLSRLQHIGRLDPLLQHLHAHPEQPHSISGMADMLHLSESRFHAAFHDAMGVSPIAYLQRLRMERARFLLLTTDARIEEVAHQCGYGDMFHFSRLFRREHGVSPLQYRKRNHKGAWSAQS